MTLEEALEKIKELETKITILEHELGLEQLLNDNLRFEIERLNHLP